MEPVTSESTHLTLLSAFGRADDGEAWGRFFQRYQPLVLNWCLRRGLPRETAEDLTQDLMIELRDKVAKFDRGQRFRPWLKAVVMNFVSNYQRKQHRQEKHLPGLGRTGSSDLQEMLAAVAAPDTAGGMADELHEQLVQDCGHAVAAVQAKVSAETWQAFWETVCAGHSGRDVARRLGKTPSAVYAAAYRVGTLLRAEYRRLAGLDDTPA